MNIGLIIAKDQVGGMERQAMLLARGLLRRGIPVTVFFNGARWLPKWSTTAKTLDFSGIPVARMHMVKFLRRFYTWLGRRFIAKSGIDLLVGYNSAESALLWAGKLPVVKVNNIRGLFFVNDAQKSGRIRYEAENGVRLLCNADFTAAELTRLGLNAGQSIKVIYNGIEDYGRISVPVAERFNLLFVAGNIIARKDPMTFCRAAAKLMHEKPQIRCLIVGDGAMRAEMKAFFATEGLSTRAEFTGLLPPAKIPYAYSDLLVNSSLFEGSSNVIYEALASGVPVTASMVGGSPAILEGKDYGRLFPKGDHLALLDTMREFVNKSLEERVRISEYARLDILENFGVERMIDSYVDYFRELLAEFPADKHNI